MSEVNITALTDVAQMALAKAGEFGATDAEVAVDQGQGLSVNVRNQELETIEYNRDKSLQVTVYVGHRSGHASTADFSESAVSDCVRSALNIARYTEEDEFSGLADKSLMAKEMHDLDLYYPHELSIEEAAQMAKRCEQAGFDAAPEITNSEGASVSSHSGVDVYANSHGFVGHSVASRHSLSAAFIAGKDNLMQRDYWYDVSRAFEQLQEAEKIGQIAANRTKMRLNARKIKTGKYPILLPPEIARTLWSHLLSAISGSRLYRRSSFLVDALDTAIFPANVSISEAPHLPQAMGSANFDAEGVATQAKPIVADGVLASYLLGSYSARKLGMQSTANAGGVHNLIVPATEKGDLLARMQSGILVTELIGFGVNMVTGDYSRGAFGYWVENGEIQYPLEEFTIAGQLSQMFASLQAIGDDVDSRSNIQTGSVLLDAMTVAGNLA